MRKDLLIEERRGIEGVMEVHQVTLVQPFYLSFSLCQPNLSDRLVVVREKKQLARGLSEGQHPGRKKKKKNKALSAYKKLLP